MLAQTLRAYPGPLSLGALIASGQRALGVVGIALLVTAFHVQFLRLSVLRPEKRQEAIAGESWVQRPSHPNRGNGRGRSRQPIDN